MEEIREKAADDGMRNPGAPRLKANRAQEPAPHWGQAFACTFHRRGPELASCSTPSTSVPSRKRSPTPPPNTVPKPDSLPKSSART